LNVLVHEKLKTPVAIDGFLEWGYLLFGNITGDILAVFVALVVVVWPFGALAQDVEGAAIHALDLSNGLEKGFGGRFGIHCGEVYVIHIYYSHKKKAKSNIR
jgi:hypothetical protein